MKLSILAIITTVLVSINSYAVAPKNDLYIGVDNKQISGISKADFNEIIDRIEDIYKPIFGSNDGNLVMYKLWHDGKVNALTKRRGDRWEVHMFGGLARFPSMTRDAFAMVVCHEIGHQVGGLPKKVDWYYNPVWAAVEGQSDYFAAAKCMRKYLAGEDHKEFIKSLHIPNIAKEKCSEVFSDLDKSALCQRIAYAGEVLANVFTAMIDQYHYVSLETPSSEVVGRTNKRGYPETQCRADTFFQGALCDIDHNIRPQNDDLHKGYCSREAGYDLGVRPLCWFDPKDRSNSQI